VADGASGSGGRATLPPISVSFIVYDSVLDACA
jgi:hypothetical protein